jgi:hypothetical protein
MWLWVTCWTDTGQPLRQSLHSRRIYTRPRYLLHTRLHHLYTHYILTFLPSSLRQYPALHRRIQTSQLPLI